MDELHLKRLLFRAHHMGSNENDILFGGFAEKYLGSMSEDQILRFERLLKETDADLFDWVTGKLPIPAEYNDDVMELILAYVHVTQKNASLA